MIIFIVFSTEDEEIIEVLFAEQNKLLFSIAFKILGSAEDAEEALQETFLKITENLLKIKNIPYPERKPYCIVIIKNISFNILRRKKKQTESLMKYFKLQEERVQDIEASILEMEDVRTLMDIINTLDETDRQMILLRLGEGLSYKKLGELFNMKENSVSKRCKRIFEKIRKEFENRGFDVNG